MKKLSLLLMAIVSISIVSCKKDNGPGQTSQQAMIAGKWNMQKQDVAEYVNDVEATSSVMTTSDKAQSYVQFDKSGSFISISLYNSDGLGSTSPSALSAVDTVKGTYNFVGSAFTLSMPSIGGLSAPTITGGSTTNIPVYVLVSKTANILLLTSSAFNLHTEFVVQETTDNITKTYRTVQDSYYTR